MAPARPPGPDLSKLVALQLFRKDPIRLLELAAATGDVSFVAMPRVPVYLLNHPDLVWDVLATDSHAFTKGPSMVAAKRVLGESLLTTEGDIHRRQRRLIQPMFHHERIAGYGDEMVQLASRAAERWSPGQDLDVHAEMARLTLAIVGRTLFDADVEGGAREIGEALNEMLRQFDRVYSPFLAITERLPLPSTRRFRAAMEVFDRTISELIAARRKTGTDGADLLSLLLRAREDGVGMTERQVRDEALTLFLAGHETTSNALAWTWHLLARNPSARERLHAELEAELGGRPPTVADLERLPVTRAVLSESMRVFPPAWAIGRRVVADHRAGAWTIPAGSVAVVSPWLLHHDPRWFPEPARFDLERWAPDANAAWPRHAYIPFGGGPRMCIGEGFASMEARLLLATIAQRWCFDEEPGYDATPMPVITLRPRGGIRMRATPREPRRVPGAA